jgi:protein-S-isoprenylcysteine O-methyltransferase Ste14
MTDLRRALRLRIVDYGAGIAWATMTGLRLHQGVDGNPFCILLAVQSAVVAYLIVIRRPAREEAGLGWRAVAWVSALLPLALQAGGTRLLPSWAGAGMSALGLGMAVWALWSLGEAFGVAPADRGLVTNGPYRWLRHPAYAGELVTVGGYALGNATAWNTGLFMLMAVCLLLRIMQEEGLIDGYGSYALQVRWRLMPGVW